MTYRDCDLPIPICPDPSSLTFLRGIAVCRFRDAASENAWVPEIGQGRELREGQFGREVSEHASMSETEMTWRGPMSALPPLRMGIARVQEDVYTRAEYPLECIEP